MKRFLIFLALALAASGTTRVYEPGNRHGGAVLPKYEVKDRADGSKAVYDVQDRHGGYILPKYIIKPDGKIYKADEPVLPVKEIK